MGASPWEYFVPYEENIASALEKLREREFQAGRFSGSESHPATIADALENSDADGTASILDMMFVSDEAGPCVVSPLRKKTLLDLFGTDRPTHEMIQANMDFYEDIDRGQGVYIVVYKDGKPTELFFGGYSFD